jgi:OOP family OmpA-OmpF porin
MNGKRTCAVAIGLALTFGLANTALAQQGVPGWYVAASVGESKIDEDREALDAEFLFLLAELGATANFTSSSLEDSDTAFALLGGYRFSRYFAIEGGYQDLGAFSYQAEGGISFPFPPGVFPVSTSIDVESSGFTLAGVGSLPLGESFDVHGKVGVFFADTESSVGAAIAGGGEAFSDSASSQELFYGVGGAFHSAGAWSVSLDYQLFKDVGDDETTSEADVDLLSLGLSYRF